MLDHARLAQGLPQHLSFDPAHADALLAELAALDGAARLTVDTAERVVVEVGSGLVVGATAGTLAGRPAYERLQHVSGPATIERIRFPSLANILVPVTELPELSGAYLLPEETGEVELPEARMETIEIELPSSAIDLASVELALLEPEPEEAAPGEPTVVASTPTEPEPQVALATPRPEPEIASARREPVVRPSQPSDRRALLSLAAEAAGPAPSSPTPRPRRGLLLWGSAAAAALLVAATAGTVAFAITGDATTTAAPIAATQEDPSDELSVEEDDDPSDQAAPSERARARALARRARRQLHRGETRAALISARRAARLRNHLPYYQVLLGDAHQANGHRSAARRAYRRALRMRPGYAPARRRLDGSALASRPATDRHG